uniref:Taurine ABC transporter, permease protein (TauC) n=1 Tax=uncultured marine thaumarchaeote KM3_70_D04 TaxID=1456250 RepID=A0A075HFY3_9ARCH|nr:taurine ABC transporter, permease protein (tauC) [uncultured marine thaumarchaeote KM3_70_D04]
MKSLSVSNLETVYELPKGGSVHALSEVFIGARVALGVSWGTLVAAELVGVEKGLGTTIYIASRFFRMDIVFVNIVIIGAIGVSMEMIMRFLEARLIPWRGKS